MHDCLSCGKDTAIYLPWRFESSPQSQPNMPCRYQNLQGINMSMERTKEEIVEQINHLIDSNINPAVAGHGGEIQFQDFDMESGRVLVMLLSLIHISEPTRR